jgi:hypothetical protein
MLAVILTLPPHQRGGLLTHTPSTRRGHTRASRSPFRLESCATESSTDLPPNSRLHSPSVTERIHRA